MKVTNLVGTSQASCQCESWLEHWGKFRSSGSLFAMCSVGGCSSLAEVGGHVKKYGLLGMVDPAPYIVPLCKFHNSSSGPMEIGFNPLVYAHPRMTCENPVAVYLAKRVKGILNK